VDVGDETWLYFTGTEDRHDWCGHGTDYSTVIETSRDKGGFAKIGLAKWTRDRIMGYQSELTDVITLLPAQEAAGQGKLILNVVTRPGGSVRAGLLDGGRKAIAGYGFEESEIIAGDLLDAVVGWKGKAGMPQAAVGQPLRASSRSVPPAPSARRASPPQADVRPAARGCGRPRAPRRSGMR
jgi:hypothetical protein